MEKKIETGIMDIKDVKLKTDKYQPRKEYDEAEIEIIAETMKTSGQDKPIDIDENNNLLDGHRRYLAMKKNKEDKIKYTKKNMHKVCICLITDFLFADLKVCI